MVLHNADGRRGPGDEGASVVELGMGVVFILALVAFLILLAVRVVGGSFANTAECWTSQGCTSTVAVDTGR